MGLGIAYELTEADQVRWWAVNAARLVALARVGAMFHHGRLVESAEAPVA